MQLLCYCILISVFALLPLHFCSAQDVPVLWSFDGKMVSDHEAKLSLKASIAPGWHLYSQFIGEGGPVPTQFIFSPSNEYELVGQATEEGTPFRYYDKLFEMEITWYEHEVQFKQLLRLHRPGVKVSGRVEFMACDSHLCIPASRPFSISID
jgi:DsbC/DsbD-like thiol-disulfide interchange protein